MALTDGIIGCWSPSVRGSGYLLPDLARRNHGICSGYSTLLPWNAAAIRARSGNVVRATGVAGQKIEADILTTGMDNYSGAWTMATWENTSVYTNLAVTFGFGVQLPTGVGSVGRYNLQYNNTFYLWGGANDWNTGIAYITGRWVFIVWAYDGTNTRLFLDGVQAATINTYTPSLNGRYATVFSNHSSGNVTTAQIGEFAIWRRALAAAEVLDLFRQGNGAIGRQLTGQTRRRVYGFVPATGARRRRILCGGNC